MQARSLSLPDASRLSLDPGMNALARNHNYFETSNVFAFAQKSVHCRTINELLFFVFF